MRVSLPSALIATAAFGAVSLLPQAVNTCHAQLAAIEDYLQGLAGSRRQADGEQAPVG